LRGVSLRLGGNITFTHIMFEGHKIVSSNGVLSESFFSTALAMCALDQDVKNELQRLSPEPSKMLNRFGRAVAQALTRNDATALWSLSHAQKLCCAPSKPQAVREDG
jgi:hypothetical protein